MPKDSLDVCLFAGESAHKKFKTTFFCTHYHIRKSARAGVFVVFVVVVVLFQRARKGLLLLLVFFFFFCSLARKVCLRNREAFLREIGEKRERKEKKSHQL